MKYDFSGWATKNDLRCSDGRVIKRDAFKDNDGQIVPLVYNHQHDDVYNVLGHAELRNCAEGVRAYCKFNEDTESGRIGKALVQHGDVRSLSIFANQLKQVGSDVLHGAIKEVSLVLAPANPGAYIDDVAFSHSDEADGEAIIYTGMGVELYHGDADGEYMTDEGYMDWLVHSAEEEDSDEDYDEDDEDDDETIGDIFDSMTDKQKNAVYAIAEAVADEMEGDDDFDYEGGNEEMKHNVFESEQGYEGNGFLSHADVEEIFADAKRCGSLREAINNAVENGVLAHSLDTTGMEVATGNQTYGFNDPSMLFPEFHNLNNPPEWISREMGWVKKVMNDVHHTPFTRIKSVYANITEDEARAKGYIKGNRKKEEVFSTLKRTTTPQTVYKKQKLDRDDILDITDLDVVAWIRAEMRVMLDEEIARAILIGDGRLPSSDDKIQENNVRPIVKDVPLFNTVVKVNVANNATSDEIAKETINAVIRARKNYKGSGNPTFYTTEDTVTELLLLEDGIGHKLYKTEAELATALRVKEIVTVEPMEGYTLEVDNADLPLVGVIVNLTDYNVGADKGGEVNTFDDFDIDYNQYKYLIETRISGALVKPFSALTVVLKRGE